MAARPAARRVSPGGLRLAALGSVMVLAWFGLGYRLFQVQVVQASDLAAQGLDQRRSEQKLVPRRGSIYDRNGEPLALTIEGLSIFAVPSEIANPVLVTQQVAAVTGLDAEVMRRALAAGTDFAYLARQLEPAMAEQVLALNHPGVYGRPEPLRTYPAGAVAAHVVGMANLDGEGIEGVEKVYDELLTGTPGLVVFEKSRDIAIPQGFHELTPAIPGHDLVTTIDLPLQYSASAACERALKATGAVGCWAVALDPETGEILAMVGAPGFDPVRRTDAAGGGFTNFAVRGQFEPGSIQKLITVAAAIDSGTFDVNTVIPEVGSRLEISEGACVSKHDDVFGCFNDVNDHETRDMTVQEIFTISSNVGTIKIGRGLAEGVLDRYLTAFGLGQPTGIDYTGEAAGAISIDPSCGTCLASAAIGYSVAATPLQMAAAYAAVANDGVWIQPHLVGSQVDVNGEVSSFSPVERQVVSEDTAWVMRQLLGLVVSEGTGSEAQVPGYRIGGKTGTADKLGDNGEYTDQQMASFVGMAPVDDPQVVVAVVIDSPDFAHRFGGVAAAPVFAEITQAALQRLGVNPDAVVG